MERGPPQDVYLPHKNNDRNTEEVATVGAEPSETPHFQMNSEGQRALGKGEEKREESEVKEEGAAR